MISRRRVAPASSCADRGIRRQLALASGTPGRLNPLFAPPAASDTDVRDRRLDDASLWVAAITQSVGQADHSSAADQHFGYAVVGADLRVVGRLAVIGMPDR